MVITVEYKMAKGDVTKLGVKEAEIPIVYFTNPDNGVGNVYMGVLEKNQIRAWVNK